MIRARLAFVLLTICLATALAPAAFARPQNVDAKTRDEITALYKKRDAALKSKNLDAILAMASEDFTATRKDGTTATREEWAAGFKELLGHLGAIDSVTTTVDSIKPGEDGAVITETTGVMMTHPAGAENEAHELTLSARSRNVWEHTDEGWMVASTEEIESSVMIDGKPIS